ncbi:unnamed protein product [Phytomonas sp. EM1]|nr:unnamed protein product [Phytomonas sp. EM1]|eukprot:CCW64033.1 unnamed protein product [Phytomonas sp. isolate EM1]
MFPWSLLQKQLLNILSRNSQYQSALKRGVERALREPTFRKFKHKSETAYQRIINFANDKSNKQQSHEGPHFSHFNIMRRKLILFWQQHAVKFFVFVTANFMAILFLIKMFPFAYTWMRMGVSYLISPIPKSKLLPCGDTGEEHTGVSLLERENCNRRSSRPKHDYSNFAPSYREQRDERMATQVFMDKASVSNDILTSSTALFDDTLANNVEAVKDMDMHCKLENDSDISTYQKNMNADFQTSFLVKMYGDTEFTSSLERENLTGTITTLGGEHV